MRPIEPISKIAEEVQSTKTTLSSVPAGVPGPTAVPTINYGVDTASLSETAAIVNRMRAAVASEGGIRPHVVAQLKHDLSLRRSERTADIEHAIARLLQEL